MTAAGEASWRKKKESTPVLGMNMILLVYRIAGKRGVLCIAWIASWLVWLFNPGARRISEDYLRRLSASAAARGVVLPRLSSRRHIYSFCRALAAKPVSWSGLADFYAIGDIDGGLRDLLGKASDPQPYLLVSAHVGNIEVIRAFNTLKVRRRVNVLMSKDQSPVFMEFIKKVNRDSAVDLLPAGEPNPAVAMELAARIEEGDWIAILGDRLLGSGTRCVEADFLGGKARFPQGPWILASLLKIPVYLAFGLNDGKNLRVYGRDLGPVRLDRKNREESVRVYVQSFADELEKILYKYPYEWFNFYDFWS